MRRVKVLINGVEVPTEVTVAGSDSVPTTSKGTLATPPGWTPAPVKNWNSRDGVIHSRNSGRPAAASSTKETTPIGEATTSELATRLVGKLLQGDGKVPKRIRQ